MAGKYTATKYGSFAADVEKWVLETEGVMINVMRQSIDDAVNLSQTPKARGGHMPIDTGFLRSTGLGSLNGWPNGPDEKVKGQKYSWDGDSVTTTLAAMQPGDTFYFGWTAVYALRQEGYNGFMETTAQKWQSIVNTNVGKLRNV